MLDIKVISEIGKEARRSIKSDSEGVLITDRLKNFVFILFFTVIPLLGASTPWFSEVKLSNLENYVGTGIAIFTGLFFSLLLNISSKIRIEKENINKDESNFQAFKENVRQISYITQYIIILGILVLIIVLLNLLVTVKFDWIEKSFTTIALFLLIRYFACLFFLLQRFYFVLRDEINNIM